MLERFGTDVWVADGPPVSALGPVKMPTRAVVVRLRDGALCVNSPVTLAPDAMTELASLGPVRYLVAPTRLHVWRLPEWKRLFPTAYVAASPG